MKLLQFSGIFWVSVGSSAMFTALQIAPYVAHTRIDGLGFFDFCLEALKISFVCFLTFWVLCMLLGAIPWRYVEKIAAKRQNSGLSYYLLSGSIISVMYGFMFIALGLWSNDSLNAFDLSFCEPAMYMVLVGASGGLSYWLAVCKKSKSTAN